MYSNALGMSRADYILKCPTILYLYIQALELQEKEQKGSSKRYISIVPGISSLRRFSRFLYLVDARLRQCKLIKLVMTKVETGFLSAGGIFLFAYRRE